MKSGVFFSFNYMDIGLYFYNLCGRPFLDKGDPPFRPVTIDVAHIVETVYGRLIGEFFQHHCSYIIVYLLL